jgi:hypothetical protein
VFRAPYFLKFSGVLGGGVTVSLTTKQESKKSKVKKRLKLVGHSLRLDRSGSDLTWRDAAAEKAQGLVVAPMRAEVVVGLVR